MPAPEESACSDDSVLHSCQSREAQRILERVSKKMPGPMCIWYKIPRAILTLNVVLRRRPHTKEACRIHLALSTVNLSITITECMCVKSKAAAFEECPWQDPPREVAPNHTVTFSWFDTLGIVRPTATTLGTGVLLPASQHRVPGHCTPSSDKMRITEASQPAPCPGLNKQSCTQGLCLLLASRQVTPMDLAG